jgi:hypothetical protein
MEYNCGKEISLIPFSSGVTNLHTIAMECAIGCAERMNGTGIFSQNQYLSNLNSMA